MQSGERVLVRGGAGGVGVNAVQLPAAFGAPVTATGRDQDAAFVRGLGAETYVSSEQGPFGGKIQDADVVLDTVGGPVLDASYGVLRPGGRLVTLSAPPSRERAKVALTGASLRLPDRPAWLPGGPYPG